MREKFSTVTVGGATFEVRGGYLDGPDVCRMYNAQYRQNPDLTVVHERCDDASCDICNRVFGEKR